jgi:hypothetical protein
VNGGRDYVELRDEAILICLVLMVGNFQRMHTENAKGAWHVTHTHTDTEHGAFLGGTRSARTIIKSLDSMHYTDASQRDK